MFNFRRILGGGYGGSWNCCKVGKPVLQWRWGGSLWSVGVPWDDCILIITTGAICQVFGLWYRYLTSSATLILPDSSFSLLASFVWDVNEKIIAWQYKFPCRVLFPPVPASGLTSYTGLSSPLRLMTMWIWSSQCERSFPGLPRSLRLRTRTLSPGRS